VEWTGIQDGFYQSPHSPEVKPQGWVKLGLEDFMELWSLGQEDTHSRGRWHNTMSRTYGLRLTRDLMSWGLPGLEPSSFQGF
jgi:hypothetical protein